MKCVRLIFTAVPWLVGLVGCAQQPPPIAPAPGTPAARGTTATPPAARAAAATQPAVSAADALAWPREFKQAGLTIRIYQPQIERWEGDRVDARAAVSVARPGQEANPTYGVVAIAARSDVDKEDRTVVLRDIKVTSATFPQAKADEAAFLAAIDQAAPDVSREIDLDHFEANVARTAALKAADAVAVRNDPPKILFAATPTLLVLVDGEPKMQPVAGNDKAMRVLNTPALILLDQSTGVYYLNAMEEWYVAKELPGPWSKATANPPAAFDTLRDEMVKSGAVDPFTPAQATAAPKDPPAVVLSTTPAELIQTQGDPQYTPIAGTKLLYLSNTDSPVFMTVDGKDVYVLVSGRWFRAASLQGPWAYVAGKDLPADFKQIPADGPRANVLVSVPGTPQAQEAVIANSIPQTAAVKLDGVKLTVTYDGEPQFKPIEGAKGLQYATNAAKPVVLVEEPRSYWCASDGVWFTSQSPLGPWAVATSVPAIVYTIPPSSPIHYVTYVRIYGTAPGVVYVGYTPGYMGTCATADGVVVYGTGYYYPAYVSTTVWYGYPPTYGYGAGFACGTYTGFAFGFYAGAWMGGCWGQPYWGSCYGCGDIDINSHNSYNNWRGGVTSVNRKYEYDADSGTSYGKRTAKSFNPYTGRAQAGGYSSYVDRDGGHFEFKRAGASYDPNTGVVRGGARRTEGNMYDGWSNTNSAAFRYNTNTNSGAAVGPNNVYAGKDGNVYRYDKDNGNWQQKTDSGWQDAQRSSSYQQNSASLNSQQQSREVGQQRYNASRGSSSSGGMRGGGGGGGGRGGGRR